MGVPLCELMLCRHISEHNRIMGSAHSNIMYSLPFHLIMVVAGMQHLVASFVSLHQIQNDKNDDNYRNDRNNNDCRERGRDY